MAESKEGVMRAVIDGGEIVIRVPLEPEPKPSSSGKSLIVASSRGNVRTALEVVGKPVYVGVTAYAR
jgi:polysaccharide deacetylase 2 family uncharacterized protein YibQ